MIRRLCIVLAHGGAVNTVRRHLPIWARNHDKTIICSPSDDPCRLPGEWGFINGKSSRYAADTNERTRQAMLLASEMNPRFLTFCEYDALLWHWPEEAILLADIEFKHNNFAMGSQFLSGDPKFKGKHYMHSPIIFNKPGLHRTLESMMRMPRDAERGFGDRYFGLAMELGGVNVWNGHKYGLSYSQNHIEPKHYEDMKTRIEAGACFTHGIKDPQALAVGMKAAKIAY